MKNVIIAVLTAVNLLLVAVVSRLPANEPVGELSAVLAEDYMSALLIDGPRTLDPGATLIDTDGRPVSCAEVACEAPKIIVRYSHMNCNVCVDSLLAHAQAFAIAEGRDKVQVWASFEDRHGFSKLLRFRGYDMDIFDASGFALPFDSLGVPYLFVLNADMTVSSLFVPRKEFPHLYDWYFRNVGQRLFGVLRGTQEEGWEE